MNVIVDVIIVVLKLIWNWCWVVFECCLVYFCCFFMLVCIGDLKLIISFMCIFWVWNNIKRVVLYLFEVFIFLKKKIDYVKSVLWFKWVYFIIIIFFLFVCVCVFVCLFVWKVDFCDYIIFLCDLFWYCILVVSFFEYFFNNLF